MSIIDLFESSKHRNNMAHFAALVSIAVIDGKINSQEEKIIKQFAFKLDITDEEYNSVIKNPEKFPLVAVHGSKKRMRMIYDLFKIIYADHNMDKIERKTVIKYAVGLGYPTKKAEQFIKKSIAIFEGKIKFREYRFLIKSDES